ncbi:MAG TPA: gephyrin-like molybdotransferase Glp [Polyangiaceae bacterium]|nr:gephyrin-like molybdotransferase Glp [Polyangiaceae bacterium]
MLDFEDARARLLAAVERLPSERVALERAHGRVLAEPVIAASPLPPFSYSAMDGYALATSDLAGAGPFELGVRGESRTGRPAEPLVPGAACAISTGAELPSGADAVVPREDAERTGDAIALTRRPKPGQHIRRAGEDLAVGGVALVPGMRLGPAALGLAASLDATELGVAVRPRVTILCTGDELRAPGSAPKPGKIPESVSPSLAALAALTGAEVRRLPPVADEPAPTRRAIAEGLGETDLLLTVGGVSVGEHDWVRPALEAEGVTLDFWKVAIKPGKPLAFGRRAGGGAWVLGLPGNPASAVITFMLFGMPLLRALQGDREPLPKTLSLPLAAPFEHKPGRLEFVRARIERHAGTQAVVPLVNQASGALTSLAWADALALIPADLAALPAGQPVEVLRVQDL